MITVVRNAHLVNPAASQPEEGELWFEDGQFISPADTADREIDAAGLWALPGIVELSANLRGPGEEAVTTIAAECRAAAAGGITTLCAEPNTIHVADSTAVVELIRDQAAAAGGADVAIIGALTVGLDGRSLSAAASLRAAGCVALGNGGKPIADSNIMRRALQYAATYDLLAMIQSVDPWLSEKGCAHAGEVASRLGLPGIPAAAEVAALARDLALVEDTGARAHFCRISTAKGVELISRAKADGLAISADVAIHHLFLTETDLLGFDPACHLIPPLRTDSDRLALRQGIKEGVIDAICAQHRPLGREHKIAPFPSAQPGASGIDLLLSLAMRLVDEKLLSPNQLMRRLATHPAQILGLPSGGFAPGMRADFSLYDPDPEWVVDEESLASGGKNTPFMGWGLCGRVCNAYVNGERRF